LKVLNSVTKGQVSEPLSSVLRWLEKDSTTSSDVPIEVAVKSQLVAITSGYQLDFTSPDLSNFHYTAFIYLTPSLQFRGRNMIRIVGKDADGQDFPSSLSGKDGLMFSYYHRPYLMSEYLKRFIVSLVNETRQSCLV
jgi:hypothetical protein